MFSVPAFSSAIQNGNMESVSQKDTKYCAKFNVVGCQQDTMKVWKPSVWDTWFGEWDFGQSWTDAHSGSWSVAVWYQPPSECRWNETTSSCGINGIGQDGSLLQSGLTFSNSSFVVSFWSKKCPFLPVQCEGWRAFWGCDGNQYYGTNGTNTGRFAFIITDENSSEQYVYPFEASDSWKKYTVTPPPLNTSHTYTVFWQTLALDLSQQEADCVLFDDFEITYGTEEESPALGYIADMTTFTNFPYSTLVNSTTPAGTGLYDASVKISRRFADVPLMNATARFYNLANICPVRWEMTLGYNDGSTLDVTNYFRNISTLTTHNCEVQHFIPLIDYQNIANISILAGNSNLYYSYNWVIALNGNLSVRATYSSPLTGYETIKGSPYLFPFIVYKNQILPDGSHSFSIFNFINRQNSNIIFELLDENGNLKDTTAESYQLEYGENAKIFDWLYEAETTDEINVTAIHNISSAETTFPLGYFSSVFNCVSGCEGTTWVEATSSESSCVREYFPNDTRCYTPPTPSIYGTDITQPIAQINQEAVIESGFGWLLPFTTPFFIITMIVLGIAAYVGRKVNSSQVALGVIMILTVILTSLGAYPVWVGVIIVVISTFMLVYLLKKTISGE